MQKLDTSAPSSTFQFSFTIFFCKSRQILFLKRVENYTVNACNTQQFGFLKVWAEMRCLLLLYSNHEMAPKVLFEAKLVFSCHTILSLLGHESDRVTHLDVWTRFHFNFSEKSWPETQLSNGGRGSCICGCSYQAFNSKAKKQMEQSHATKLLMVERSLMEILLCRTISVFWLKMNRRRN